MGGSHTSEREVQFASVCVCSVCHSGRQLTSKGEV